MKFVSCISLLLVFTLAVLNPVYSYADSADEPLLLAQGADDVERPAKKEKKKKKKDKRVCKRVRSTGSRIPERICRKQSDWDRITKESRESVERSYEGSGRVTAGGES